MRVILEPRELRVSEVVEPEEKPLNSVFFKGMEWYTTEIVPDWKSKTLQAIIRVKVSIESDIHSDTWRGYSDLVDLGYQKHYRVKHGINEFISGKSHINGIESFFAFAKTRLSKFRGLDKNTFYLHLKESEFRFNHRNNRNTLEKNSQNYQRKSVKPV